MKEGDSLVYFATKNKGKYAEAKQVASEHGIHLAHLNWDKYEIQDDNISRIAALAAEVASRESGKNFVVAEDAGFFVNALHGFPGPYSSYVYEKLGVHGILKLMKDVTQRRAYFSSAIACSSRGSASVCFEGIVRGSLCHAPRGSRGFGFDPIFIPTQGDGRTFAEMNIEEKNQLSHRAVAFGKFCTWFTARHGEK